jgi:hypothetical protein
LPRAAQQAEGVDHTYRLYLSDLTTSLCICDVNGEPLIESHVFENQADAIRWAGLHERERRLLHSAKRVVA